MKRVLFILLMMACSPVQAADMAGAPECNAIAEAIVDLRVPEYPSGVVWASTLGQADTDERYIGAMVTESGFVMGAGERVVPGRSEIELVVTMLDDRGRTEWEKIHHVKGLRALVAVALVEGNVRERGMWVLGQRKTGDNRPEIWLGFFDPGGELIHNRTINGKLPLVPNDIVSLGNNRLMVAASEETPDGRHHSVIYRLDGKGNVTGHNAYAFGLNNNILSLSKAGDDGVMAAGSVETDDDRPAGWLMLMNARGDIVWQRPYPRGRAAQFNAVVDYVDGFMIAAGQSAPAGGGSRAAWLMVFDRNSGQSAWQRYYRGNLHFAARDILPEGDIFSVLVDSRRPDKGEDETAMRLLTLNGRGNVVATEFFQNAKGVQAEQLLRGKMGERVVVGNTVVETRTPIVNVPGPPKPGIKAQVPSQQDPDFEITQSRDLWALAAVPVPAWQDPCKPSGTEAP